MRAVHFFIMECLINYIGLQSCENQEPSVSGKYINTIPGISLESIDKIANADQASYAGVWRDAQIEAAATFKPNFMTALNKCYTLSRHCDYDEMICENIELLSEAWRYLLAYHLMLYRIYSNRLNRFTTVDEGKAKELAGEYNARYQDMLSDAIKLVDVSACCQTQSNNNPTRVEWLP